MYQRPPLRIDANVANVAGQATVTILAAPGANFRYRVVGCQLGIGRTATGIVDLVVFDGAAGTVMARASGLQLTGNSQREPPIPEPGIVQAANNVLLQLSATSTAAAGTSFATVYYFIDQVT